MAFQSFASERFWQLYGELPVEVQRLADKQYELFRQDPSHPSLHFKQVGEGVYGARWPIPPRYRLPRRRHFPLGLDWLARSL